MKIIFCDNSYQEKWNNFIFENSTDFGLLQSWEWGELKRKAKSEKRKINEIFRLAILDDSNGILAVAQVLIQPLKLGKTYFYIPRGPILADNKLVADKQAEILEMLFESIKSLAKENRAVFLRMDPAWRDSEDLKHILELSGFLSVGQVQPKSTLILDLSLSEEELLAQMKPKTRYNIKIAQKHNIEIDEGDKYFEDFWKLMEKTSGRQEIVSHSKKYYKNLLEVLGQAGLAKLMVAKYDNKVIVANIVINIGRWCVYLHGASDYDQRDKMAPFLLQWQTILNAQKQGCKYYDFWGVDEIKWPGVTRFKYGFSKNREVTNYIGAWDEIYSKFWYTIYRLLKR